MSDSQARKYLAILKFDNIVTATMR